MYGAWIEVLQHEALLGNATARQGIDALSAMRQWSKGKALKPMLYNLVLDAVAKAAIHSKGSTEEGEEVLLSLFFSFFCANLHYCTLVCAAGADTSVCCRC
jgi:hypothetical protein